MNKIIDLVELTKSIKIIDNKAFIVCNDDSNLTISIKDLVRLNHTLGGRLAEKIEED